MENERFVPDVFKVLGKNIKKIRMAENVSQEQLAEKINKSPHLVGLFERGKCGISVPTIIDICNALNIDANSVFADVIQSDTNASDTILLKTLNSFDENEKAIVRSLIEFIGSKN